MPFGVVCWARGKGSVSYGEILPTHWTRALAQQPGTDALQVEGVGAVARELDDERVGIVEELLGADGTGALRVRLEPLARHAV